MLLYYRNRLDEALVMEIMDKMADYIFWGKEKIKIPSNHHLVRWNVEMECDDFGSDIASIKKRLLETRYTTSHIIPSDWVNIIIKDITSWKLDVDSVYMVMPSLVDALLLPQIITHRH